MLILEKIQESPMSIRPEETLEPRRRAGGRAARQALRAAPLAESVRPVRAGLAGGAYRPLSEADVQRIHRAALEACAEIGFADAPPSGVEILTEAGGELGSDGRIRLPRSLVEDMMAIAGRDITLFGQDRSEERRVGKARGGWWSR